MFHLYPVIVIDIMQDKQDVNDIGIPSSKSELSSCRSDNREEWEHDLFLVGSSTLMLQTPLGACLSLV